MSGSAVTGAALHPLRTLPHPPPPPWLHDRIIATIASEADHRVHRRSASDAIGGSGGRAIR